MGDIDIDSFGCVAISPLWLGGSERQNALTILHSCEGVKGANEVPITAIYIYMYMYMYVYMNINMNLYIYMTPSPSFTRVKE